MLKKVDLTNEDQLQLDPHGKAREWIRGLQSHVDFTPNPPLNIWSLSPSEMLERYLAIMHGLTLDENYVRYNESMIKHYGAQGGSVPFSVIEQLLCKYYLPEYTDQTVIHPILYRGRDFLLRIIKQLIEKYGGPDYVREVGITGTHGGLPTFQKKGSFDAETMLAGIFEHLLPAVPGTRYMRGKPRTIFMDATVNVRATQHILAAVKRWLLKYLPHLFSTWMNPYYLRNRIITRALERRLTSVEGDYREMDVHFRKQIVMELIMPIYEILLPDYFVRFASLVEEMFSLPLYMGNQLWTGEHTWFSGLNPTNDFETLYSIILMLGVLLTVDTNGYIMALGDDLSLYVPDSVAESVMDTMLEVTNTSGMEMHPLGTKSNINRGFSTFCREYFSLGNKSLDLCGKRIITGQYPSVLALNSIVQPEKLNGSLALTISSTLQRLDNVRFNKEYVHFLQFVRKYCKEPLTSPAGELPQDWWERLYGEKWRPESSASFVFYRDGKIPQFTVPTQALNYRVPNGVLYPYL